MTTTCSTKHHPTTQYALDVVEGKRLAGKYEILACERHLNDLQRQGTDSFPYIFDEERASKVFDFSEKYCKVTEDGHDIKIGDPIILPEFAKFSIGSIFGWVHKDTGLRRFRKAYEQVARKNIKSTKLSVVGLYMFAADGEGGPQVYTAALDRDQAKIIYDMSAKMVKMSKPLRKRIKVTDSRNIMQHKRNGGKMLPLSKDSNNKDGFNPHCALIDEYHAHKTSEIYDVLASAMGMRQHPLIYVITTAGYNINGPCHEEYEYCKKVLEGIYENEEYFIYIAQMDEDDDIYDERNWIKANPLLATTEAGMDYLRSEMKIAREQQSKRRGVLTKNFNIWIDQKDQGYMDMSKWRACGASEENPFPDLANHVCVSGMDLSKKIDLTSVGFEIPLMDGRFAVLSHSFIPEETLQEKIQTDNVPYDQWVKDGWITVTPGAVVDYRYIQKYVAEQFEKHNWSGREVCYDEWSAGLIVQEMSEEGFEMVEIPQRITTLSEPTKNFREMVYSGKIIHNNNPVLDWAVSNAIEHVDVSENIRLVKNKSVDRIDPICALINAHVRAVFAKPEVSVYEKRGLRQL